MNIIKAMRMRTATIQNPFMQLAQGAALGALIIASLFMFSANAKADHSSGGSCNTGFDNDCDGSMNSGVPYWKQDIDDDDPSIGGWNTPCGQFGCR